MTSVFTAAFPLDTLRERLLGFKVLDDGTNEEEKLLVCVLVKAFNIFDPLGLWLCPIHILMVKGERANPNPLIKKKDLKELFEHIDGVYVGDYAEVNPSRVLPALPGKGRGLIP